MSAGSPHELAEALGIDPDGLESTMDLWRRAVEQGQDPDFGRVVFPLSATPVPDGPVHASRMVIGINFPAGGFRVTTDMEVVDVRGRTIPGLFAVGDCVGGIAPAIGLGGLKITPAVTLGRVAGRVAASEGSRRDARVVGDALLGAGGIRHDRHTRISVVDLEEPR